MSKENLKNILKELEEESINLYKELWKEIGECEICQSKQYNEGVIDVSINLCRKHKDMHSEIHKILDTINNKKGEYTDKIYEESSHGNVSPNIFLIDFSKFNTTEIDTNDY